MAKIVSKLDLNKTPQLVDNNSLVFAKNVKLLKDGSIGPDTAIDIATIAPGVIVGYVVGVNSKIYLFCVEGLKVAQTLTFPLLKAFAGLSPCKITISNPFDTKEYIFSMTLVGSDTPIYTGASGVIHTFILYTIQSYLGGEYATGTDRATLNTYYPYSTVIKLEYADVTQTINYSVLENADVNVGIYEYNEVNRSLTKIDCAWNYSGGKIAGVATVNNTNEEILTVCEYFDDNSKLVPIKHINLAHCSSDDNESLYTQAPIIPITNLTLQDTYTKTIPNGVYQFFVRYEIYDKFYTNWIPCSKECFAGVPKVTNTVQGSVKYIEKSLDSPKSFIFSVEHLFSNISKHYKSFQIGFILSHDDSINARAWKHFDFSVNQIYFDYDADFITEINIDDLLKTPYEIFNVKNVDYFRNKLYISNYIESNINPDLQSVADTINCTLKTYDVSTTVDNTVYIDGKPLSEETSGKYSKIGDKTPSELATNPYFVKEVVEDNTTSLTDIIYKLRAEFDEWNEDDFFVVLSGLNVGFWGNDAGLRPLPHFKYEVQPNDDKRWNTNGRKYSDSINGTSNIVLLKMKNDAPAWTKLYSTGNHIWDNYSLLKYKWYDASQKNSNTPRNGANNVYAYNDNFTNWQTRSKGFIKDILARTNQAYPKKLLTKVSILTADNYPVYFYLADRTTQSIDVTAYDSDFIQAISSNIANDFRGTFIDNKTEQDIFEEYIKEHIKKVDASGKFYIRGKIDSSTHMFSVDEDDTQNSDIIVNKYEIEYIDFNYSIIESSPHFDRTTEQSPNNNNDTLYIAKDGINSNATRHLYTNTISIKSELISSSNTEILKQNRTLLPFTEYEFYIHYIQNNGVFTNGYRIGKNEVYMLDAFVNSNNNSLSSTTIIYPTFSNITIPDGYCGYFISICKVGDDIARGFNHTYNSDTAEHRIDCLEADMLLYNINDNITILNDAGEIVTEEAKYYPSSTTDPINLFGNVGCIMWTDSEDSTTGGVWIKITAKDTNKPESRKLIKLTPYLTENNNTDFSDLNMPGYLSRVCKPQDVFITGEIDKKLFINGSDAYKFSITGTSNVKLEDYTTEIEYKNTYSTPIYIHSNFNLHYISLIEDLNSKFRSYNVYDTITEEGHTYEDTNKIISKGRQMIFLLDSSTISYIYNLPQMYKEYTRKLYTPVSKYNISIFNNTVRASNINADEVYKNIYIFDALDYYNVPTNKGKIVNLFSIEQSIYIHCEHSLFKFSGVNSLFSEGKEVKLGESDVFDTGITEVFDSEYGFAGIQNKRHSLVTFNSYIFYDSIAKVIYGYFGNNNIVNISESIEKLIKPERIDDIFFVADTDNDRFYANIKYEEGNNICLSFNFKTKSFVSIHDLDFSDGFASRHNTYFLAGSNKNLYHIDRYETITKYRDLYVTSRLHNVDMNLPIEDSVENCLDIVCNVEYEKIKVLDYINWICSNITAYNESSDTYKAEENIEKYAGTRIRIYSDQCSTPLIELENSAGQIYEQNRQALSNPNSYQYPRYNCGVWSLNYFRDIRNTDDIFNYSTKIPPTQIEIDNDRGLVNSDKSLMYGKYLVARFIFRNKNFKLENITFNIKDYEKV